MLAATPRRPTPQPHVTNPKAGDRPAQNDPSGNHTTNKRAATVALALLAATLLAAGCADEQAPPNTPQAITEPHAEELFLALPRAATLLGTYKCRGQGPNSEGKTTTLGENVYGRYHYRAFICFSTELDKDGLYVPPGSVTATFHLNHTGKPIIDNWHTEP